MTVHTEDIAELMPRLPSKKRFQRVDCGTKLMCSMGAIRQKRAKTMSSFVRAHRGGSSFAGIAESSCRNMMVEVVANSVAWSRRVFASSGARRIFTIPLKIITVLTRYRPIVFELLCCRNDCNFLRRRFFDFI